MHNLEKYFKDKITTNNLTEVIIYLRIKDNSGKQIQISYNKYSYNNMYTMDIVHFTNYIKADTEKIFLSSFGISYIIAFTSFKKYLNNFVTSGNKKNLIINICDAKIIPSEENNYEFEYDRTFTSESTKDECPICKLEWNELHQINLKCNHYVCINCLFALFLQNKTNCPICRKALL